ncbi:LysR family transcriptional regulator [Streptomonospora nanhaiensis]|uniref:DNA-binding transcriptional LysR family regulator n=1 Tax=Streptomonospora nanhaiensis TaxID=1323731 RepID=A0A853BPK8_9ACTN|nr:LysR family transcriptional regulator [Streptomonospora nanhaiensis]MBV2361820.1 LysR family transcriptional regulator [Streptomonospora nanhaiensis]MBX9388343.1 LysR family transcriptional regulator [Streptomonospora nanhaiensis]NYI96362.1 DNA-binding transcriptional LysR family regulator [Streptomonospora nanhaiensis]
MDVDTRLLRYFAAVAEELHFTRAAERLYVSQPALSRQIRRLERDLRVTLFERTTRGVRLTPAGEALLPVARRMIDDWAAGQRAARTARAAAQRVLRLGFEATGAADLTTRARMRFRERHPDASIEPHRFNWGGEVAALREGLVDAALIWLPNDLSGLTTEIVAEEPRAVGMRADHPLAAKDVLTIEDLRDEPLPWARSAPREWVEWWAVVPRPDGSRPRWGPANDNAEELLENVAGGSGVCIVSRSISVYYRRPDLVWRPLVGVEPLRIALGWTHECAHPLLPAFAAIVRELRAPELAHEVPRRHGPRPAEAGPAGPEPSGGAPGPAPAPG